MRESESETGLSEDVGFASSPESAKTGLRVWRGDCVDAAFFGVGI